MTATPVMTAPAPGARVSASLWVGDLDPEVNEAVLAELFSPLAPVQGIRVCRSVTTRESLGYAYVNFQTPADAEKAMVVLNYTPIKGKPCRIMFSQRDPTLRRNNVGNLFVKNLSPEVTSRDLHDAFLSFGTLLSVKVASDEATSLSKGYGFVHFDTEAAAKAAVESIDGVVFMNAKIKVEAYLPKGARDAKEKWLNVFVKNVPKTWSVEKLAENFSVYGEITSAVIMRDAAQVSLGFGFVCFKEHEEALKACAGAHGRVLEGEAPVAVSATDEEGGAAAAGADGADGKEGKEGKEGGKEGAPTVLRVPKLYVAKAQKKTDRQRIMKDQQESSRRERAEKFTGQNLYVRNLDESVDDDRLRKEFEAFGPIQSAKVAKDAANNTRGYGFVCFSQAEDAVKARDKMNRMQVAGKPLFVNMWESKETRKASQAQTAQHRLAGARAGQAGGGGANLGAGAGGMPGMPGMQGMPGAQGGNPMMNMNNNMMNPNMMVSLRLSLHCWSFVLSSLSRAPCVVC
jgi:polyadenylate-binding protein